MCLLLLGLLWDGSQSFPVGSCSSKWVSLIQRLSLLEHLPAKTLSVFSALPEAPVWKQMSSADNFLKANADTGAVVDDRNVIFSAMGVHWCGVSWTRLVFPGHSESIDPRHIVFALRASKSFGQCDTASRMLPM